MSLFSSVAGTRFSSTRCDGEQEVLHKIKNAHGVKLFFHAARRQIPDLFFTSVSTRGNQTPTVIHFFFRCRPAHFLSDLRPAVLSYVSVSVSCYTFIISNLVWPVLPLMVTGDTATFGP